MAVCLLPGYIWLVVSGTLLILWADYFVTGRLYDAMLHSLALGFVFSMIFGHAPLILPAITGIPIPFHPRFYFHLALLHASLGLRLWGDLVAWPEARAWGGLLNVTAILIFIVSTAWAARSAAILPTTNA
jgi:hypothetical protein